MARKRWIKLWTQETLFGTTFKELEPDERAVWFGFLALAGDSPTPGTICVSPEIPYTRTQMCQILNVKRALLNRAIDKMFQFGKINVNGDGCFTIASWTHYQGDYVRVQEHRERYKSNTEDDVTNENENVTKGTEQSRTEEEEEQTRTEQTISERDERGVVDIHESHCGPIGHPPEALMNIFMEMQAYAMEDIDAAYDAAIEARAQYPAGYALTILKSQEHEESTSLSESAPVQEKDARLLGIIQRCHVDWGPTWEECRESLREQVPHTTFHWIEGINSMAVEDNSVVLRVPTPAHAEHLRNRLHKLVRKAICGVMGRDIELEFYGDSA